ncbi:TonB-dependent receptor [Halosquirtibacter laminarini]|uniref:TonB-dependent receptor n=1 Tax=Halosquirtibacter laminarini TaxID=3374600 RepID=A0AC61NKP0_9BACT|nr:TonB-dependent receptor [Prolixibacteraceae bacterium]
MSSKVGILFLFVSLLVPHVFASNPPVEIHTSINQSQKKSIKGVVRDENGETLPGANVTIKGSTSGVITGLDGTFEMLVNPTDIIKISYIGYEVKELKVENRVNFDVTLKSDQNEIEEVTIVAFGKQKKESVIASIETVDTKELKVPSSNLTTALAGRMSGVISYQRSGEPGQDNASFFVRGISTFGTNNNPLILIDNVESTTTELSSLNPDDIASFSVMKDATAAALYGSRGANGVLLIKTKEGRVGKVSVSFRAETSISQPTFDLDLVDPVTFMEQYNATSMSRSPNTKLPFAPEKIHFTKKNVNPYVYPAVDWRDMMFDKQTVNQRYNMNVTGGGKFAKYFLAASLTDDNGNLKMDKRNNFNSNINLKKYQVRSNVNFNFSDNTKGAIKITGQFDDYIGPVDGGSSLYNQALDASPVLFPAFYAPDEANKYTNHVLFGNFEENATYRNPYAQMVRGYKEYSRTNINFQAELSHEFDFIKGLKWRALANTTRRSYFDVIRKYNPYFYSVGNYDIMNDTYVLNNLNPTEGTEYLSYSEEGKSMETTMYFETALNYDKTINEKHNFGSMLVFTMQSRLKAFTGNIQQSLAYRNTGLAGRFTYNYDSKYLLELNFGYNGSERFAEKNRFGFFPSAGLGWNVSKEAFYKNNGISNVIDKLKLKGTYGLVGNDNISGSAEDRFFYLANVNMNSSGFGASFGNRFGEYADGVEILRYPNHDITWEIAEKMDLGVEFSLFKSITFVIDYFQENRSNILMKRNIPSTMGLQANVKSNAGEAESSGIDASMDINHSFNKNFWISGRGNFTYATGTFTKYEEPAYPDTPWRSHEGMKLGQQYGLIAERLFVDEADVKNSPVQQFGDYGAGDIKYKDLNNDGIISNLDKTAIGLPTTPEIVYGAGISLGLYNFDFSCFFQGSARSSFWIDYNNTAPFISDGDNKGQRGLLQAYMDDHWTEENRDIYALFPRFDDGSNTNNGQTSTWFMRDGSFLRLKSLEFGYTFPKNFTKSVGITNFRVYYSGSNLAYWSEFDLWDTEMGGSGFKYPLQKVHNIGVQLSF